MKRIVTGAVVLFAAAIVAAADPSPRVAGFLGDRAAATLAGATRVEVFRLSPQRAGENQPSLGGYLVTAKGAERGEPFAQRLAAVLLDPSTYDFESSKRGGFEPVVGFKAWKNGEWVEVVLSFTNAELVVLSTTSDGVLRSAQEDFDAARPALLQLAKESLPNDPDVQTLTEK
jgi:hypothetical protein